MVEDDDSKADALASMRAECDRLVSSGHRPAAVAEYALTAATQLLIGAASPAEAAALYIRAAHALLRGDTPDLLAGILPSLGK